MRYALIGGRVFTGERMLRDHAVIINDEWIVSVVARGSLPHDLPVIDRSDCLITPGFIDTQCNGGGGILLNDHPTAEAMVAVYQAHKRFGTAHLLPTIMTTSLDVMAQACRAEHDAWQMSGGGILGTHLEGPYISDERPGVHDPKFIRLATDAELDELLKLESRLLVTAAPESITPRQIARLVEMGRVVSLGHTNATYEEAMAAFDAGATAVTHLFNAMSGFEHRAPGVVGAVLNARDVFAGVIADGFHVHWSAIEVAYKLLGDRLMLVTDAMPPVGTTGMKSFRLSDREVFVGEGRLVDSNGRLAGAHIDMASCVRNCVENTRIPLEDVLRMASLTPAKMLRMDSDYGRIRPQGAASLTLLDDGLYAKGVVVRGHYESFDQP
jgi:N-acetylglucosamine-6-phosphate deacetylase